MDALLRIHLALNLYASPLAALSFCRTCSNMFKELEALDSGPPRPLTSSNLKMSTCFHRILRIVLLFTDVVFSLLTSGEVIFCWYSDAM